MNTVPDDHGQPVNLAGGRGTRIPDLRLLLAVHAARQATGPTARIVREGDPQVETGDEPSRLTLVFGSAGKNPSIQRKAAGSFNERVATHLATGRASIAAGGDGEAKIYSGD